MKTHVASPVSNLLRRAGAAFRSFCETRALVAGWTAAAAALCLPSAQVAYGQLPGGYNWQYQFGDDFSGTALDTSKWQYGPDWGMSTAAPTAVDNSKVKIGDGLLTLEATRTKEFGSSAGGDENFAGGVISTYQKHTFSPANEIYIEARILLPSTPGTWPAFWALQDGWPPECDIMEYPLTTNGSSGYASDLYHTALHYNIGSGNQSGAGTANPGNAGDLRYSYHNFAVLWRSGDFMRFFFDGVQCQQIESDSPVASMTYMYLILNHAVGSWPGTPSLAQWPIGFTDEMKVDWVRVWKNEAGKTSDWAYTGTSLDPYWNDNANWTNGSPDLGGVTSTFNTVATAASQRLQWPGRRTTSVLNFDGSTPYQIGYGVFGAGLYDRLALVWGNNATLKPAINVAATSSVSHSVASELEIAGGLDINNNSSQPFTLSAEVMGDGGIHINGAGTVVFDTDNTYGGNTVIDSGAAGPGIARARGQNSFGLGGTVIIGETGNATTGRMELENNSLVANNIDFRGRNNSSVGIQSLGGNNTISGTISANVGGSTYLIQSDADTLTLSGADSDATAGGVAIQAYSGSRAFTLQGAGDGVVSGKIQNGGGSVGITKDGNGNWTLHGANTYTDPTQVNAGTLGFSSAPSNIGGVTVANGANLRVRSAGAGTTTLTSVSLTLGASTLTFDFNSFSTTAPLISTGAFTVNGTTGVAFQNAGALPVGTYPLVAYSSFGGGGSLPSGVIPVGPRGTGQLVNSGGMLSLNVLTNDLPIWTGAVSGVWASASPNNWKLQSNSAPTAYLEGDNVLFDDSATGTTSVGINSGNVSPAAVNFDNSSKTYTVSGANGIAGTAPLVKSGTGTVNLNTANTFTGAVTVNGGTLYANPGNAANNRAFSYASDITVNSGTLKAGPNGFFGWDGSQVKPITVHTGGTLTIDGTGNDVNVGTVTLAGGMLAGGPSTDWGSWNFGRAAGVNPGSGKLAATENSTVTATNLFFSNGASIDVASGKTLTVSGTITDGNNEGVCSLVKSGGTGTLVLSGTNPYSGGTTISAGTVSIGNDNQLGANDTPVTIDGGTLKTTAYVFNTHPITIGPAGGTIHVSTTGQYFFNINNVLRGSGPLTLTGNGTLTENTGNLRLNQGNTYSGAITVKLGGILEYGAGGAIDGASALTVENQGEIAVNNGINLPNSITVSGNTNSVLSFENGDSGVFSGPISLGSGANLTVALRDWYNHANTRSGTISGAISGGGGLVVTNGTGGGGVLTLSNTNTFTGGTTVNSGTLSLATGGANGTIRGTLTINPGAAVQLDAIDALGYSNASSPVTQINLNGGTLNNNVAGNNSASASWTLTGGTMTSTGGGSFHIGYNAANSITTNASSTQSTISGNVALRSGNTPLVTVADGAAATDLLISGAISQGDGPSGITKTGAGTLTLTGASTYTGPTSLNAGTTLVTGSLGNTAVTVASGATLGGSGDLGGNVTIGAGAHHALAVAATPGAQVTRTIGGILDLTAAGDILDLTAAAEPAVGDYTLATATGGITGGVGDTVVNLTGIPNGSVAVVGNSLVLTVSPASAYSAWALAQGLTGLNNGPTDDPDFDGIWNVLEFVLGGNPLASDTDILPVATTTAADFVYTFSRADESEDEVDLTFEYSPTMAPASWTQIAIGENGAPSGPEVVITENADSPDTITVTVPKGANVKLFGRLEAEK